MSDEAGRTPADQLRELMERAQNPFDVSDAVLARLEGAVLSRVELYGWRHRKSPAPGLRCSSYRHLFLLTDGDCLPLWELRYDSAEGPGPLYEVYDTPQALARSARRVHAGLGDSPWQDGPEDLTEPDPPAAGSGTPGEPPSPPGLFTPPHPPADGPTGTPAGPVPSESGTAARAPEPLTAAKAPYVRAYASGGSPEHARRLLRRAENGDRPGSDVLALLAEARGHEILHIPRPRPLAREWSVWCSVYEHAFLLADGSETSLYEVEHNLSPTGRLICEVYCDEDAAERGVVRRAREHGLEL